jgi:predicted metal-dependent hydrolase
LVAYEFRRSKRKTIGFSAGADGLTVSAPKWVPLYEIDKAVLEKAGLDSCQAAGNPRAP